MSATLPADRVSVLPEELENIAIEGTETASDTDHRFSRFSLISWWDQDRISNARILVVGAGALGNEILKNLVLTGFRQILVVDLDQIEHSNLSRSVLYRPDDIGKSKAATAAQASMRIFEEAVVHPLNANICFDIGMGVFEWADVIIGGLDNRAARLWINQCAWKLSKPWIDGAIQGISGVAKVFLPGSPPCYECTLNELDMKLADAQLRNPCTGLTVKEMKGGKTPTTPTISSIIAGIQVQEALKLIHKDVKVDEDMDGNPLFMEQTVLHGKGYHFEGLNHTSYITEYTEKEDCSAHHTFERENLFYLDCTSEEVTLEGLLLQARTDLGDETAFIEFSRNIIHKMVCHQCGVDELVFRTMASEEDANCPECHAERETVWASGYSGEEEYGDKNISQLGLPLFDIVSAYAGESEIHYLLAGDVEKALGPLAGSFLSK